MQKKSWMDCQYQVCISMEFLADCIEIWGYLIVIRMIKFALVCTFHSKNDQEDKLDNIWQHIARIRSATVWSEARISQKISLPRESDAHIYAVSIPPRSCKSLESRFDRHMRIVKRRKPAIHRSVTKAYED